MMWREHALIGAVIALAAALLLGYRDIISLFLFTSIGALSALVPDLDHHASKGRQWLDRAVPIFAFAFSYLSACGNNLCLPNIEVIKSALALIGIYFVFFTFFKPKHRGITHSILAVLIYTALLWVVFNAPLALVGGLGYLSHLAADREFKLF